jgi:hypothetical protein
LNVSPLVALIVERLESVGYRQIPTPFSVATIPFDFTAALQGHGGRSTDLVLIVDTSLSHGATKIGNRARQRLEALSRALDIAGSNRALTAVLAGASLPPQMIESISKSCRVLVLTDDPRMAKLSQQEAAFLEFEDRLRVLLPLQLTPDDQAAADPIGQILSHLPNKELEEAAAPLLAASSRGEKAVSRAFTEMLEAELAKGLPQ